MEDSTLVALIASLTSVVVALFSFIGMLINNRNQVKANKTIESLKLELEKKKIFFKFPEQEVKSRIEALGLTIQKIQRFKDILQLILNSSDESLDVKTAMTFIKTSKEDILFHYQNNSVFLQKEENEISHKAKNLVFEIEHKIHNSFNGKLYVELSETTRSYLIDSRHLLTDFQNSLRDYRFNLISFFE